MNCSLSILETSVVALGVGAYERRELKYAGRDASRVSEVLHARGLDAAGSPGVRIFLNPQANAASPPDSSPESTRDPDR